MEHYSWFTLLNLGRYDHVLGALLVVLFLVYAGFVVRRNVKKSDAVLPEAKPTLTNVFEMLTLDFMLNLFASVLGTREAARRYLPLLGATFVFILCANLLGLLPGFQPPTGNFNTPVACALVIFVMYNFYGFREHGIGYLKHFTGPFLWLAPLMVVVELVSHIVRPVSLSLRLFWNITGDHLVLGIFTNLTHFIIPAAFVALGVFVSVLQAFIFTLLSAIYISLAVSHEH